MPRSRSITAALTALLGLSGAAVGACSSTTSSPSPPPPPASHSLVVFAAASLEPTFTTLGQRFESDNPGTTVDFNFAGSSELATQLTQGATADAFASADTAQMHVVEQAGLIAASAVNFASNTLVIVTAPGNPKHVESFADLTKPGLNVVVCQQPVPCGAAAHKIEEDTGVQLDPVSEEPDVTDVLNKVTTGQADAGLVYVTDARSAGDKVSTVVFAQAARAVNVYPVAVLRTAAQPALARKFVDLVTGASGQKVLDQAGFGRP